MRIKKAVYDQILDYCPVVPPEVGGILGASTDAIDFVAFDVGSGEMKSATYIPNVVMLNQKLNEWQQNGISFRGLFHTHPKDQNTLSQDDIEYIEKIMFALHPIVSVLYFPIVIPQSHLISYKAINQNHSILIASDIIDLVP